MNEIQEQPILKGFVVFLSTPIDTSIIGRARRNQGLRAENTNSYTYYARDMSIFRSNRQQTQPTVRRQPDRIYFLFVDVIKKNGIQYVQIYGYLDGGLFYICAYYQRYYYFQIVDSPYYSFD